MKDRENNVKRVAACAMSRNVFRLIPRQRKFAMTADVVINTKNVTE